MAIVVQMNVSSMAAARLVVIQKTSLAVSAAYVSKKTPCDKRNIHAIRKFDGYAPCVVRSTYA